MTRVTRMEPVLGMPYGGRIKDLPEGQDVYAIVKATVDIGLLYAELGMCRDDEHAERTPAENDALDAWVRQTHAEMIAPVDDSGEHIDPALRA